MSVIRSVSNYQGNPIEILIEVDESETNGKNAYNPYTDTRDATADKIRELAENVGDAFGDGIRLARQCAAEAIDNFQKMPHQIKPDEVELQLSIKIGGELKVPMIAKGTGEGQINVTMKWKMKDNPPLVNNQTNP